MDLLVLLSRGKGAFPSLDLIFLLDSLSSETSLSHKSLNLGGFVPVGIDVLLALEGSSDDVLFNQSNRVLEGLFTFTLLNTIELSDASSSLGSQSAGLGLVSESGHFLIALLDEGEGKGLDVRADNAASD